MRELVIISYVVRSARPDMHLRVRVITNVSEVFRGEFSKRVVADDDGVGSAAAPAVGDGGSSDIDEERCWDSVCVADSPNTPYYFHLS
ncbi:hypothetical protein HZH66_006975 [Vespula vulgaris]|uniref:Uncharacterized protein n=1 Tax=Vespula vulgaris TaxID=7454 RepID=A0A834JWT3_VESVU|nr:hypothetical protein HZH66_006975 [Vespula vulgaris]